MKRIPVSDAFCMHKWLYYHRPNANQLRAVGINILYRWFVCKHPIVLVNETTTPFSFWICPSGLGGPSVLFLDFMPRQCNVSEIHNNHRILYLPRQTLHHQRGDRHPVPVTLLIPASASVRCHSICEIMRDVRIGQPIPYFYAWR